MDMNDSFLKSQITDDQSKAMLEENWAEYEAKVKDNEKSNFDEYSKHP